MLLILSAETMFINMCSIKVRPVLSPFGNIWITNSFIVLKLGAEKIKIYIVLSKVLTPFIIQADVCIPSSDFRQPCIPSFTLTSDNHLY